jgi:chaperonin cofactor prefoldin
MKLAASYQKDSEKLKLKIEDHVREENRLKSELAKAQAALRSSAKKPSGDSGADQAA